MSTDPAEVRFVDLDATEKSADLLAQFYGALYTAEFPDPNERESLANMVGYLAHDGAFGNAYLVTIMLAGERIVGGSVADYFVRSNCGAIEFLVVERSRRRRGFGARLTRHTEERIASAAAARARSVQFVMAEINDPLKRSATPDNVDPFERVQFWAKLHYRRASFPYVQPPLSDQQAAVTNLLLGVRPIEAPDAAAMPAATIEAFLRDYLIYAMRIDVPEDTPEFAAMKRYLDDHATISLVALDP